LRNKEYLLSGDLMRIIVAHNRYQLGGGEDAVVRDEVAMLRQHGHVVELLEQDNSAIHGIRGSLIASSSIFYSAGSRKRMKQALHDFCPDIVHIHNWFPLLSPSIILEANSSGIPVVQTLHNYRMLCANALLYRDGAVCTDCLGKSLPIDGIIHGCYRDSRAGSAIVTAAYAFHRFIRTWDRINLFITVSDFEREILVRGGLPADKVVVKPNFINSESLTVEGNREDVALYVGRLSPEKGIRMLLSAWSLGRIPFHLHIIGDGPLADEVRSCAARNSNVEYLGLRSQDEVYREMAKAKFMVCPSECYETFGRTVVEAFSQGTPVLAADIGCMRELVEDGDTGYRYPPGNVDALVAGTLRFSVGDEYERMHAKCRKLFLDKYTANINYPLLMDVYERAIAAQKKR
jgi:glycosyltransferase involved in cell wall biosynthesis